ncbi:hypothetical protein [Marinomonas sp.]
MTAFKTITEPCPTCGGDSIQRTGFFEACAPNSEELSIKMHSIKKAIKNYYLALDRGDTPLIFQIKAFREIEEILMMNWKPGATTRYLNKHPKLKELYPSLSTLKYSRLEALIDQVKAMHHSPENTEHEWLFSWSTPTQKNYLSDEESLELMSKSWRHFRVHCKRNDIELQGFQLLSTTKNNKYPVFVTALLIHNRSLENIKDMLSSQFDNSEWHLISIQMESKEDTIEFIERYFTKLHPPISAKIISCIASDSTIFQPSK